LQEKKKGAWVVDVATESKGEWERGRGEVKKKPGNARTAMFLLGGVAGKEARTGLPTILSGLKGGRGLSCIGYQVYKGKCF